MRLKNDMPLRDKLFTPDSYQHPAKGHIGMWQAMIEMYTEPGQWVLDPMAGIGTTLTAALVGRNVICNEMEQHFIEPMLASWHKMRQHPMLGYSLGEVLIIRGDARHMPLNSADAVVTSPPWEGGTAFQNNFKPPHEQHEVLHSYTRPVDAVVTSPPYEGTDITQDAHSSTQGKATHAGGLYRRYTRPVDANHNFATENIGNQKGDAYWESMRQVYLECHRVLKDDGLMVLVLKGFTRNGQYIDLPGQTTELVETLGFEKVDEWWRELWVLSFWRILQKKNNPDGWDERLRYEAVLAYKKVAS